MKILFNNNFNIRNINFKKQNVSFGNEFSDEIKFQTSPLTQDSFVKDSSKKQIQYGDIALYQEFHGKQNNREEVKEVLMEGYAGWLYLSALEMNLFGLENGAYSFERINEKILPKISPKNREKIAEALKKGGINTPEQLADMVKLHRQLKTKDKTSASRGLEFIEIYGQLDEPQEILNFTKLMVASNLSNRVLGTEYDLNEFSNFAKSLKIKNETAFFDKKFAHFKSKFNNFEEATDRINAFEYIRLSHSVKMPIIGIIKSINPKLEDVNAEEFYLKHTELVDYLFEEHNNSFATKLYKLMIYLTSQEEALYPNALKIAQNFADIKTTKGKVDLYEFLADEGISTSEMNILTKEQHLSDINMSDIILNRNDIINHLMGSLGLEYATSVVTYACFSQILNAINNDNETYFTTDPTLNLFYTIVNLDIADEKEFIKFYLDISSPQTKNSKNKKGQNQNRKVTQKEIISFINLLSFIDGNMIEKYKKDKNYPIYKELKNREAEFRKVEKELERLIDKKHARYLCHSSFEIFMEEYNLFKLNPNLEFFVDKVIKKREEETKGKESANLIFEKLLGYFKDEDLLKEFLIKNNIWLNNPENKHSAICLELLSALFENKTEEELENICTKLTKSDFIANSKNKFAGFVASKSKEEISALFEIILNENIKSVTEINGLLKPYFGEDKSIKQFLLHFKNQNMDFKTYLTKIAQIQKELDSAGFDIKINNDNIFAISQEDLKERKLPFERIVALLKELQKTPSKDGNFLCGLDNSLISVCENYTPNRIAKEIIYSQTGRYKESYSGLIEKFNLSAQDFGLKNAGVESYQKAIENSLQTNLKPLFDFINSDIWTINCGENKIPNLSLHSKMRLIDRFILQENKNLLTLETIKEIQEILNVVYKTKPYKIEKSDTANALYYLHEDYEIKAVFTKEGEMLTIAKNKL